ncbi:hypothetical protein MWH28_01060 [Natroniella sulfidigena]|uniref:hypothetical protein n=1 Tax=Natroniella sulfidigena TaxID=723921 RepID=UPI00200A96ED|nr:hypothetical protein [Natroniella sulfidigena]MCK8815953.1 hypothetical protein [Natroniella sulfidigena]
MIFFKLDEDDQKEEDYKKYPPANPYTLFLIFILLLLSDITISTIQMMLEDKEHFSIFR